MARQRILLRYVDDDHCDLLRNGRQLLADITWQTAKQWLRKNVTPQDNILREESDGYRVPVKLSRL